MFTNEEAWVWWADQLLFWVDKNMDFSLLLKIATITRHQCTLDIPGITTEDYFTTLCTTNDITLQTIYLRRQFENCVKFILQAEQPASTLKMSISL